MGQPDGGWYDEQPPRVVSTTPDDKGTEVKAQKVTILFDEYIKLDNPTEKVVVSPPQLEAPEIKTAGRGIVVELKDSLKANTTYTIDFSDAISDNNEGNPMGNYTYSFSTGSHIDTLEVAGTVLNAEDLEPLKGILVGLYPAPDDVEVGSEADSLFTTTPLLRVARTDSRGRFVIKGVAPGTYRAYALHDMDGNFFFSQKSEMLAFTTQSFVPGAYPDTRQDTLWTDSLHIKNITPTRYTHYTPDNLVLTAFTETLTDRLLLKQERKEANRFSLFFTYGSEELPALRGLNFDEKDAFIIESTAHNDTITYWLRDSALINQDTLIVAMTYQATDSMGQLQQLTDTLELLSKQPYAKRMKQLERDREQWEKQQARQKKRGEPYDSIMPPKKLSVDLRLQADMDPDSNPRFAFESPLARVDTAAIHLYAKHDTLWYDVPMEWEATAHRQYVLRAAWTPATEYSLEVDSAAFTDIYGHASSKLKKGFRVKGEDEYATLLLSITGFEGRHALVELLNESGKLVKQLSTDTGQAEFFWLAPGTYYARLVADDNANGQWDTGDYGERRQAEAVYYYPKKLECRAKWDITETWNPTTLPLDKQKPGAITQQKAEQEKRRKNQNAKRAKDLGIELPAELQRFRD